MLPAEEVVAIPHSLNFIQAAALPHVSLTAWRGLVDAGKIKPHVSEVMPLAETPKALEMLMGGHTRGKIVLQVAG